MQTISPIKPTAFLYQSKRLDELTKIRSVSIKLLKLKKDRLKLEDKFKKTKDTFAAKQKTLDKEKAQETKKRISKKSKLIQKGQDIASIGLMDLFMTFIKFKALMWLGDPENLAKVQAIVKGLSGVFKFIDWFATGSVTNLLDGLHSLLFGGSILERILGLFSAIVGFFGIRYLLNPFKLIKDLRFIIKNGDKIGEIFNAFRKAGIKEGAANLIQNLTKTASIFKRGLARGLTRAVLKVFGKTGLKFLAKAAAPAVGGILKLVGGPLKAIAGKTVAGIPVVGPLLNLGINLLLGDPVDKAIVKTVGSTLGMGLGAVVGSVFPGPGTIVGGALGGIVGDWAAANLYDWMKSAFSKKEEPKLAVGGIVTKPTRAIIGEAGPEAVIPLGHIYNGSLLSAPFGMVASSIIGGIDALLASMGPVGLSIRPFAQQLLAPYTKEFGKTNYTFTSDIAKKSGNVNTKIAETEEEQTNVELNKIIGDGLSLSVLQKKETEKRERYNSGNSVREILADILNNIINLDSTSPGGPGGPGGTVEDPTGEVQPSDYPKSNDEAFKKIFDIAVKLGDPVPELTAAQAMFESGWLKSPKARLDNNPFGQTGSGTAGKVWSNGRWWARYKTYDDAVKARIVRWANGTPAGGPGYASKDGAPIPGLLTILETYAPGSENNHSSYISSVKRILVSYGFNPDKKNSPSQLKLQTGGMISRGDITSQFGNKESFRKNAHEGIDVGINSGTGLSFTLGGKITALGRTSSKEREANGGYGQYMDVKLSDGKIARLAHLSSIPKWVQQGKDFPANTIIAVSGGIPGAPGSGRSGGAHLHLEQHTTQKDLAETLNGKVDPVKGGIFSLLRRGGSEGSGASSPSSPTQDTTQSTETSSSTTTQAEPSATWETVAAELGNLAKLLIGEPKVDSTALAAKSMDFVQAANLPPLVSDTYIIPQQVNIASRFNLVQPMPQVDYSQGSFSQIDSSSYLLQRRL